VATGDVLDSQMAGPAIRAWEIASALSSEHSVHLVSALACGIEDAPFPVSFVDEPGFDELVEWCDVAIFQGHLMRQFPRLRRGDRVVVADVYDPFHLEILEQARDEPLPERQRLTADCVDVLNEQLLRSDFVLCASSKQRDFWLGQLAALGRINPKTYDEDESLDSLIAVVPFGVRDDPPVPTRSAIRGRVPGIARDDLVVMWGGGIYNWFDPLTLLHAIDRIKDRVPRVRLFFLGLKHPNPHVGEMRMAVETRRLADALGLTGTYVFFNEDWVAYDDRHNYLCDADVGISTHLDHIETAFSFRTRILDYFWAGLPVIATQGDALADMVESRALGLTVPPTDVDALATAMERILCDDGFRASCARNSSAAAADLKWSRVLEPLLQFCRVPRRAPDLTDPGVPRVEVRVGPTGAARFRNDVQIVVDGIRRRQFRELTRRATSRIRRARPAP